MWSKFSADMEEGESSEERGREEMSCAAWMLKDSSTFV
jgi:hypothetical protein